MMTELGLYAPMLEYLVSARRIRADTLISQEFPLHGRSVDLVSLTKTGSLTAYEFKLRDMSRVLRQGAYNLRSFDQSNIVVSRRPTSAWISMASKLGIGVYVVTGHTVVRMLKAGTPRCVAAARSRAERKMQQRGIPWGDHVRI